MPEVRLIDANALYAEITNNFLATRHHYDEQTRGVHIGAYSHCLYTIEKQPTIKPEVRRGRWINDDSQGKNICTCCNKGTWRGYGMFDYCPHCGADMREDEDE